MPASLEGRRGMMRKGHLTELERTSTDPWCRHDANPCTMRVTFTPDDAAGRSTMPSLDLRTQNTFEPHT